MVWRLVHEFLSCAGKPPISTLLLDLFLFFRSGHKNALLFFAVIQVYNSYLIYRSIDNQWFKYSSDPV